MSFSHKQFNLVILLHIFYLVVKMNSTQFDWFTVSQGGISNILEELVVQPLLVSISALTLATETVRSILKIDDVVRLHILILRFDLVLFHVQCELRISLLQVNTR